MSIKLVKEEIERFLTTSETEVICINGKWGIGKTYTWNYFLSEAKSLHKIALTRYAYVSLFGLKKLEDLRYSIYEATKPVEKIGEDWKWENLKDTRGIKDSLSYSLRWVTAQFSKNPIVQSYIGTTENMLFYFVGKEIICIDDLERAGDGLNVMDVFGLISFLKEQRGCKIVLLLNEEEIEASQKVTFHKQLEKVVDTYMEFIPNPREAADIVFPEPDGMHKKLHNFCITLGIVNIRVIKKIEKICIRLEEILKDKYPDLLPQAFQTATLFAWGKYQKDDQPPPFEFLKDIGRLHGILKEKEKTPECDRRWSALMAEYKFESVDEFDLAIYNIVQSGVFDKDSLLKAAEKQNQGFTKGKREQVLQDTWALYHDSFDDNEKDVMDAIFNVSMENLNVISPSTLDATVKTLKEFGRQVQATSLTKAYIKERGEESDLFDGRHTLFDTGPRDEEVVQAFEGARDKFVDGRKPADVLEDMIKKHGWNPEDVELIDKLTADDFYTLFKTERGDRLHCVIHAALGLKDLDVDGESIAKRATAALVRIGGENRLNAKRVANQGVKLPEYFSEDV